jgi:hypothetical protein
MNELDICEFKRPAKRKRPDAAMEETLLMALRARNGKADAEIVSSCKKATGQPKRITKSGSAWQLLPTDSCKYARKYLRNQKRSAKNRGALLF